MPYQIEFAKAVKSHLDVLTAGQRSTVLGAIEKQLTNEPSKETRNRKPLRPNPHCALGVACATDASILRSEQKGHTPVVQILAVGIKTRQTLRIGGEEIKL